MNARHVECASCCVVCCVNVVCVLLLVCRVIVSFVRRMRMRSGYNRLRCVPYAAVVVLAKVCSDRGFFVVTGFTGTTIPR